MCFGMFLMVKCKYRSSMNSLTHWFDLFLSRPVVHLGGSRTSCAAHVVPPSSSIGSIHILYTRLQDPLSPLRLDDSSLQPSRPFICSLFLWLPCQHIMIRPTRHTTGIYFYFVSPCARLHGCIAQFLSRLSE